MRTLIFTRILWIGILMTGMIWTALAPEARANEMTLNQAFEQALKENPGVKAVAERINQAKERVVQARAGYFPTLDITAGASKREISRNEADSGSGLDRRSEYYNGFLTGKWVLFSGFERKYTLEAAKLGEDYQTQGQNDLIRILLASVAQSFHSAQLALANQAIASASRDFYASQLETARIKQTAGVGSLSDVLNVNTRMNQAMIEMERYAAEYDVARASLAALVGEDARGPDLPGPVFPKDETPEEMVNPDSEALITHALDQRPDIAQLKLAAAIAKADAQTAKARFYPELSLKGSIGADRIDSSRFESDDIENSLGLELSYPLYAGGRDRARLREALSAETEAELKLKELNIQVVSQVRQDCFTVAAAQRQLALYRENGKLVTQNRDMVAKEYQFGKTDLINLNEVQNNLTQTQQRIALSLISLRQAWYELKAATGTIYAQEDEPELP